MGRIIALARSLKIKYMENKSAENIIILDFATGKVFIEAVPLSMIEDDANEIVEKMADRLGIRESDCQYMVVNDDNFITDTRPNATGDKVPFADVYNMTSPRGNKEVPNQFVIETSEGRFFKSYQSMIAFIPKGEGKTILDESKWDYSTTTGKYRNQFLGEDKKETEKKIKSGEYILADLNKANR